MGLFEGDVQSISWRLSTQAERTADELWVLVSRLFADRGVETGRIAGVVLSSVVPALTPTVVEMVEHGLAREVLLVDASNAGLPILYKKPEEVGADRLVNAVAARALYGGADRPTIVVDFGTATTPSTRSPARVSIWGASSVPGWRSLRMPSSSARPVCLASRSGSPTS